MIDRTYGDGGLGSGFGGLAVGRSTSFDNGA